MNQQIHNEAPVIPSPSTSAATAELKLPKATAPPAGEAATETPPPVVPPLAVQQVAPDKLHPHPLNRAV